MSQPTTNNNQPSTSHENEVLVRVNGVSKKFCRDLKKSLWYGVKDVASELFPFGKKSVTSCQLPVDGKEKTNNFQPTTNNHSPSLRDGEFWANKDISFELRRGESLGLIGRNGAGKTTLLKMLNGLIKPDQGSIEMRGRVGALIALGAGFNPILTGRENIYVNGSILGLSRKEIDSKIEDIIDFADIRDFIDSPVQSYSSGMQVRLGFAVATALNPDVLILDEVLAVGDAAFRNKCYRRISSIRENSCLIFVSHSMEQVSLVCDKCLMISQGKIVYFGEIEGGIEAYENFNDTGERENKFCTFHHPVRKFNAKSENYKISPGQCVSIKFDLELLESLPDSYLRIVVYNSRESIIAAGDFNLNKFDIDPTSGNHSWEIELKELHLRRGKYKFGINLVSNLGDIVAWSFKEIEVNIHQSSINAYADYQLEIEKFVATGDEF
jgi:lipopolysaccharide transport system ATP-binding protein